MKNINLCRRIVPVLFFISVSLISVPPAFAGDSASKQVFDPDLELEDRTTGLYSRYENVISLLVDSDEAAYAAFKRRAKTVSFAVLSEYTPWWTGKVTEPLTALAQNSDETVVSLFRRTVRNSSQIRVFADLPLIRKTSIQEADGAFDFRIYAGGKYSDIDEFSGNDLQTGGPLRYKEKETSINYGIKKRFATGGEIDLGQEIGFFDTNSVYLNPIDQAKTKTNLTFTQPLLKGMGPDYNLSTIKLAETDHKSAEAELVRQLESHLLEVARSYWGLYFERSILIQKTKLAEVTEEAYNNLQRRIDMDAQPGIVARTKSLMTSRWLDVDRAEFAVYNAQSRLLALIEDNALISREGLEIVTSQAPVNYPFVISLDRIYNQSLHNRKEIEAGILQLHSAAIHLGRAENEIMPDLDLFAKTYLDGLQGEYKYGDAYSQQFDEGRPSYSVGLRFEYPLGNNSAEARLSRRRIEIRQMLNQLDLTVRNVFLEVSVSYRDVIKNINEVASRYEILHSSSEELDDLRESIDYQLSIDASYGDLLYRLLDASERLAEAEEKFSLAQLTFNLSLFNLRKATGTLVASQDISTETIEEDGLPVLKVHMK
jgi:outer membrane protein